MNADFPVEAIRLDFPCLQQQVNGKPLVYLDSAATAQKPRQVIDAISQYYQRDNANVHRAVHVLAERATIAYEAARTSVQQFIGAQSTKEIIFTSGTTESINLVALSLSFGMLQAGDEIVIGYTEHHSNIVPWQMLCQRTGAKLKVIPMLESGDLDQTAYQSLLNSKTKLLAIGHISNALGTVNPVKKMINQAKAVGAMTLIDGAQAVPHQKVDVQDLGCDFYAFSGHKMYGPTGIGVLYGKQALLEQMTPVQGGGEMIREVSFNGTTYNELPHKFEAGTPNIAQAIGLAAAIAYLDNIGLEKIANYEQQLLAYAQQKLKNIDGVRILGESDHKAAVISFMIEQIHAHDVGSIIASDGVCVRVGHHCAMPVMDFYQVPATVRASLSFYNTKQEIDALVDSIHNVKRLFQA